MTVTNSLTHQMYPGRLVFPSYITVTALDVTDPINGAGIDVTGLDIRSIAASATITGANATVTGNLILQGSLNGVDYFDLKDTSGNTISTGATAVSAASPSVPIILSIETDGKGRKDFGLKTVRAQLDQATSAGITGVVSLVINTTSPKHT